MSYKDICDFEGIITKPMALSFIDKSKEEPLVQKSIKRNMKIVKLKAKINHEKDSRKKQRFMQDLDKIISEEVSFLIKINLEKEIVYDVNAHRQYLSNRLSA
jgi:hypothetical protein